jgi:ribonuclease PH
MPDQMNTINPSVLRADGRLPGDLRPLRLQPGIAPACKGSAMISFGSTQVICGASVDKGVPSWMKAQGVAGGWITAEYSMLPYSTKERNRRETMKPSGRTMEIQRLIGRSMRSVIDLAALGENTITIDCDVVQADGGTRTASITGGWIALRLACKPACSKGPDHRRTRAETGRGHSVGMVQAGRVLDVDYTGGFVAAEVDMNVVMSSDGRFIEVQGTGEESTFSRAELDQLLDVAASGLETIFQWQRDQVALAEV